MRTLNSKAMYKHYRKFSAQLNHRNQTAGERIKMYCYCELTIRDMVVYFPDDLGDRLADIVQPTEEEETTWRGQFVR